MISKGRNQDNVAFSDTLEDIPTLDDVRLEGGFFSGTDRGEWLRNLEHHLRYGDELLMVWGEPGVGKSTLLNHLASRLDPGVFAVVTLDAKRGASAEHLWGALDRKFSLPHGAEGWEQLKRVAKKLGAAGQTLAIIVDHADRLNKDAIGLMAALLDLHLPECRFLLSLDGMGVNPQGQWPLIESSLLERGQATRVWPFSEEDCNAYVDFRLQYAQLTDVNFGAKQKHAIFERSEGNPAVIRTEMQRLLTGGASSPTLGASASAKKQSAGVTKKSASPKANPASKAAKTKSPKKPLVLPKAHTVAMGVLALALLGFYLVWEKPIPESVIHTPLPTAQSLPPVLKSELASTPAEIAAEPPASGLASPIKPEGGNGAEVLSAGVLNVSGAPAAGNAKTALAFASQGDLRAPPGFVPSNVPLMASQIGSGRESAESVASPARKVSKPKVATTTSPPSTLGKAPTKAVAASASKSVKAPQPSAKTKPMVVAKAAPAAAPAAAPKTGYTLQIMGLRDQRSVQAFMRQNAGVQGLTYHTSSLNGQPWYVIVQGQYPTREAAQAAVKKLPAALQASKPFPKSLAAVQGVK